MRNHGRTTSTNDDGFRRIEVIAVAFNDPRLRPDSRSACWRRAVARWRQRRTHGAIRNVAEILTPFPARRVAVRDGARAVGPRVDLDVPHTDAIRPRSGAGGRET